MLDKSRTAAGKSKQAPELSGFWSGLYLELSRIWSGLYLEWPVSGAEQDLELSGLWKSSGFWRGLYLPHTACLVARSNYRFHVTFYPISRVGQNIYIWCTHDIFGRENTKYTHMVVTKSHTRTHQQTNKHKIQIHARKHVHTHTHTRTHTHKHTHTLTHSLTHIHTQATPTDSALRASYSGARPSPSPSLHRRTPTPSLVPRPPSQAPTPHRVSLGVPGSSSGSQSSAGANSGLAAKGCLAGEGGNITDNLLNL